LEKIKSLFTTRKGLKGLIYWGDFLPIGTYLFWEFRFQPKLTASNQPNFYQDFRQKRKKLIYEIFVDKKRTPVVLSDIPASLKEATISIEDKTLQ